MYEITAVNDCSPDNVLDVLRKLSFNENQLKVIDLAKNVGKHAAMMAGYSVVLGDIIVNLDDDGQCPMNKLWIISLIRRLSDNLFNAFPKQNLYQLLHSIVVHSNISNKLFSIKINRSEKILIMK